MVHRPADSRLLTNLLNHDKDYSKHLSILLDYSHASLASFSAYASASSPPTSQVIIAVAAVLAGADDALRNYAAAVQRWQEQLKALKTMEDRVGNIMRDREILVTRLIKASKSSQKPARDTSSILGGTSSPSGSSLNVAKPEVQVGQKLSVAQAELQACEAHLAAKEQELSAFRAHTIKSGLEARCKAMVECGWAWGEMGKEGMRSLEGLDTANGYGSPSMHPYLQQGLNGNDKAGSDVSSIAPSQSASQIGHGSPPGTHVDPIWRSTSPPPRATSPQPYTLQIPAAHSISEYTVPNSVAHPATIVEEGGSSEDENENAEGVQFEVHENPLFSKGKAKSTPPSRHHSFSVRHPKASETDAASHSTRSESPAKRRGVLGSLAALFHVGGSRGSDAEHSPNGSPSKNGRWRTRIDQNLVAAQHGDSSEDDVPSHAYPMRASSPSPVKNDEEDAELARLKKRTKRGSVQAPRPSRVATDKGYASDTVSESVSKATRARKRTVSKPPAIDGIGGSLRIPSEAGPSSGHRLKKAGPPPVGSPPSLSRNSSMSKQSAISAASAPPRISPTTQAALGRAKSESVRKRTASLDVQPSKAGPSHKRTASVSTPNGAPVPTVRSSLTTAHGESSLMSIVEGISRMNREAAFKQDPNRMLVVPQAPGPINIAYSESLGELPVIRATPPTPVAPSHPQPQQNGTARPRKKKEGEQQNPEENNYRNSLLLSASVSAPTLPLSGAANHAKAGPSKPLPNSPSQKMPLRSALRNSSRSPSPAGASLDNAVNGAISQTTPVKTPAQAQVTPNGPVRPVRSPEPAAAPAPVGPALSAEPLPMKRRDSDVSSISSYETGREVFVDDEPEAGESPPLPPIPLPTPMIQPPDGHAHGFAFQNGDAHQQHQQHQHQQNGSELSHSTTSTAVQAQPEPPRRRKSVRMSLPPTFSATPPAMDDTDEGEEGERRRPWATPPPQRGGWGSRIEEETQRDMWADSDEEEAEYGAAKRMLARLGGGRR